ncbi:MAG TPA: hypothetical protein VFU15_15820 [Bacteroidia bacterium]|nr:hypothetical protein [Bacteroidia bacterium]
MKRLFIILLIAAPLLSMTAVKSWNYLNPEIVPDLKPYDVALSNSDLDKYRYFDKRNTLHFDTGLDVELLSANEMIAAGMPVNKDHVRTQEPSFDTKPVFKLTTDGKLLEVQTRIKIK